LGLFPYSGYVKRKFHTSLLDLYIERQDIPRMLVLVDEVTSDDSEMPNFEWYASIHHLAGDTARESDLVQRQQRQYDLSIKSKGIDRLGIRVFDSSVFRPIGHTALLDVYVKAHKLGIIQCNQLVLLGGKENFANPALVEYFDQYVSRVVGDDPCRELRKFLNPIEERLSVVKCGPGGSEVLKLSQFVSKVNIEWEASGQKCLLRLSDMHRKEGYKILKSMGIPDDGWFCGLHVREGKDFLRDVRDADIQTYKLAIEEIRRRGGWIIRLGNSQMTRLSMDHVIDLPYTIYNSDWFNVFVFAEGKFLVGTGSGPLAVPHCFGKGLAISNWGPLRETACTSDDILLPKHYYLRSENRMLTPEERFSERFGYLESRSALRNLGIEVLDNSPEELRELVIEMFNKLDKHSTAEHSMCPIQSEFNDLALSSGIYPSRIASVYRGLPVR
ncbi:MAG: TIGR04372 family glycosyltransferase, partial [Betaproteobacteria bacterium]|nr:TIGR04372 family glycosyltransferase [Betaproteobacteria bacterium]